MRIEYPNKEFLFDASGDHVTFNAIVNPYSALIHQGYKSIDLSWNKKISIKKTDLEDNFEPMEDTGGLNYSKTSKFGLVYEYWYHIDHNFYMIIGKDKSKYRYLEDDEESEEENSEYLKISTVLYKYENIQDVYKFLNDITEDKLSSDNKIDIIIQTQQGYEFREHTIKPLDLDIKTMYNDDFEDVHEHIIDKLNTGNKGIILLHGEKGCLSLGTKVLMLDGSYKEVQDVKVGDKLMGPDSTERNVLSLKRGREQMYWIRQNKGQDYRVNENHILSLVKYSPDRYSRYTDSDGKRKIDYTIDPLKNKKQEVVNITVSEYLKFNNTQKLYHRGYISNSIKFDKKEITIDPYFLGLWLGDGSSDNTRVTIGEKDMEILTGFLKDYCEEFQLCKFSEYENLRPTKSPVSTYGIVNDRGNSGVVKNELLTLMREYGLINNKHIPDDYLYNSEENRLSLLAGLIDSDGSKDGKNYSITQKDKKLSEQIVFLSRSLGFKTSISKRISKMTRKDGSIYQCDTWRVFIVGNDMEKIPVKLKRKKILNTEISDFKDRRLTGIKVEKDIIDDYYGFELDGDNLFLLEDFTVTHNTGKTNYLKWLTRQVDSKFVFVPINMIGHISSPAFIGDLIENKGSILVIEDCEQYIQDRRGSDTSIVSPLLQLTDGFLSDIVNIKIIATFNDDSAKIDPALKREGRLIAEYEFDKLKAEKVSKLTDGEYNEDMTLAEIYNTLTYQKNQKKETKIGFGLA